MTMKIRRLSDLRLVVASASQTVDHGRRASRETITSQSTSQHNRAQPVLGSSFVDVQAALGGVSRSVTDSNDCGKMFSGSTTLA
jgi:hypothetical protein